MNADSISDTSRLSRRTVLSSAAGAGLIGLAGCIGGTASGGDNHDNDHSHDDEESSVAVASFFTFYDFARQIADGTSVEVENLVPVGMHGHGWEPDPSITRDIIDADAFIHVGEDFQPWADRAIQTVHDDNAETHLINVREGIDLLDLAETVDEEEEVSDGKDPHFWLNPNLAKQAVDNIAAGLVEVAPDHEATLADNADTLRSELEELDEEWQAIFDAAERDVVFLAAHNAFEYIGEHYGATVQPLVTNLAATDDIRPEDMRRARETIDDHDLRYMGAAVFEPRRPAQQLLEETNVEAYFPITPYAGTTEEWVDRGWGYFEIARNINMPTFEIVLGGSDPEETPLNDEWRNFE